MTSRPSVAFVIIALSACAPKYELDTAQKQVSELQSRVVTLQSQITELQAKATASEEEVAKLKSEAAEALAEAAASFLHSGPSVVLSRCVPKSTPLNCPNSQLLGKSALKRFTDNNDESHKITFQSFKYSGMEADFRSGTTVQLSVTSDSWGLPAGLSIGVSKDELLAKLPFLRNVPPTSDGATLQYAHCQGESCVTFIFAGEGNALTKVSWAFYYD